MKTAYRSSPRARRLAVESLEGRQMLATASLAGGLLFINGAAGNVNETVTVTQAADGRLTVTGVVGGPRTLGPAIGIYADLGGGNDTLNIGTPLAPLPLLTGVSLRLGDGNDTANLSINMPGILIIDGGLQFSGVQNDVINIDRSIIGSAIVNTWAGDDQLNINESIVLSLVANLGFTFNGIRDYDSVDIDASALGSASIALGDSGASAVLTNDVDISSTIFGLLTITGGTGIDDVRIDSAGAGVGSWIPEHLVNTAETLEPLLDSLLSRLPVELLLNNLDLLLARLPSLGSLPLPGGLDLGEILGEITIADIENFDLSDTIEDLLDGVDLDFVGDTTTIGSLTVNTFTGNDVVTIFGTNVLTSATILTGQGNDDVTLSGLNVGAALYVALGLGNDDLILSAVASSTAFLDGGIGPNDGISNLGNPNLGRRSRSIFNFDFLLPPITT